MPLAAPSLRLETEQGFRLVRLANSNVELTVIPELGAKIGSLRDVGSDREWLWRPPGPLRLFRNAPGDSFAHGTLLGADECLPTIGACTVGGRQLPDHGEAWSQAWQLDTEALAQNVILTSLELPDSSLAIQRTVSLDGPVVTLDYVLHNRSAERQPFIWALHPLLSYVTGDRLHLPTEVDQVRVELSSRADSPPGASWAWPSPRADMYLSSLNLGAGEAYAKFFTARLQVGEARIENPQTGDRLVVRWPAAALPYAGIWVTRGGWRGAHHPAIEPTNAPHDVLADALREPPPELFIEAAGTRRWSVQLESSSVR